MTQRHTRIIEECIALAETLEEFGDARVAAILANKNKIISYGFNSSKSHPIATRYNRTEGKIFPHAEVVCLHSASRKLSLKDISKCTLYVARVKRPLRKSRIFVSGLSKPCPSCQAAISAFGIKQVLWTQEAPCECGEWKGGEW